MTLERPVTLYDRMRARPGWRWRAAFALAGALVAVLVACAGYTIARGIGVWGTNMPVGWAFAIVNFVFWIGIGHAGTFISAILYLAEQPWRAPLSRIAETMTLLAVVQAGLFPFLHLGRPWFAYWLLPYPQALGVWPQVKSPLPWDLAAIATYFAVSMLFWYVGMLPDLAALRDRATGRRQLVYGLLAMGWRGSSRAWRTWKAAYLLLAAIAAPLVISVHSIVAMDFAVGLTPGWHSTLLPVVFVVGAVLSGFALVLVLLIAVRAAFDLRDVITVRHLERCARLLLVASVFMTYSYLAEAFSAWYAGDPAARSLLHSATPLALAVSIGGNVVVPQTLWSRRVRTSPRLLLAVGLVVLIAMWCERFALIIGALLRDQLPAGWGAYAPTWVDIGVLVGTVGCFGLLFVAFLRVLPFVSVAETRTSGEAR
jgi:molybdopterin-containing oxidoreductase family membrane subunit